MAFLELTIWDQATNLFGSGSGLKFDLLAAFKCGNATCLKRQQQQKKNTLATSTFNRSLFAAWRSAVVRQEMENMLYDCKS